MRGRGRRDLYCRGRRDLGRGGRGGLRDRDGRGRRNGRGPAFRLLLLDFRSRRRLIVRQHR
ncbi:MAG TPA: hypothetical protein DDY78_10615 [Planctomycetales bacterium]|nr:hypothetical protein [Planctomycetales bacterium]